MGVGDVLQPSIAKFSMMRRSLVRIALESTNEKLPSNTLP